MSIRLPLLFTKARDPFSCYSHFWGAVLSVVGLAAMSVFIIKGDCATVTALSCLLFCLSLIALYSASGLYHYSNAAPGVQRLLRKLDHAMIYVLIAGTYTPLLLNILPRPRGAVFTLGVWAFAAGGTLLKLLWIDAPRWLGAMIYLVMGWAILLDLQALALLAPFALVMLIAGGAFYTAGGVIYIVKRPNISKDFGFHELFHLFILAGSACHYFMVFSFVAF